MPHRARTVLNAIALLTAITLLPVTGVGRVQAQPDGPSSLPQVLADHGLNATAALLTSADVLLDAPLTVFAPTDVAWASFTEEAAARGLDLDDPATVNLLVGYHVIQGEALDADALAAAGDLLTAEGEALAATLDDDGALLINEGRAGVLASVPFGGGVVHILDYVLLPPVLAGAPVAQPPTTLVDVLATAPGTFDTLGALLLAAGEPYTSLLGDPAAGPVTLFAPTDAAFAIDGLTADAAAALPVEEAQQMVAAHIMPGAIQSLASLVVAEVGLMGDGRELLFRETADGRVDINGGRATVLTDGLPADNGVVYVLDRSLTLPPSLAEGAQPSLAARVRQDPQFTVLAALLDATAFGTLLADSADAGPFTLLAPTDAAFAALAAELGYDDVNALAAALDAETLARVAAYHVLGDAYSAAFFVGTTGGTVPTLDGATLSMNAVGGGTPLRVDVADDVTVVFNGGRAGVAVADVTAANGLLHIIDAVLLPPDLRDQLLAAQGQ